MIKTILIVALCVSIVNAVSFQCEFTTATATTIGNVYTCRPTVINADAGPVLDSVTGNHAIGKNNNNVDCLWVLNQVLKYVPQNIINFFPNIKVLAWYSSGLQSVSAADFQSFPNLLYFESMGNPIVTIDSDLFLYTPKVTYVGFNYNSLESVGADLLTGLNFLEVVYFEQNTCINRIAETRAAIDLLNKDLPFLCPPPTTVPPSTTPPTTTAPTTSPPTTVAPTTVLPPTSPPETTHAPPECPVECLSSFNEIKNSITDADMLLKKAKNNYAFIKPKLVELSGDFGMQNVVWNFKTLSNPIRFLQAERMKQSTLNFNLHQAETKQNEDIMELKIDLQRLKTDFAFNAKTQEDNNLKLLELETLLNLANL